MGGVGSSDREELAGRAWEAVFAYVSTRKAAFLEVAVEFELTPGDLQALMALDPDEARPMKSIAAEFKCDPSNATWMIDRLEQRGIVERRVMEHDRRVRGVVVTATGRALRDRVVARLSQPPPEFARLTADELESLRCVLGKLIAPADDR